MASQPQRRKDDTITMSLIGHATVLINMYGKWILTDPLLFKKSGIHIGDRKIGISRLTPPALEVADIPHLDYIMLSHVHMDHWDKQTLSALLKKFPNRVHIICPRNTSSRLSAYKNIASVTEVEWGETKTVEGLTIRGGETRHRGALGPWERYRTYTKGHHKAKGHNSFLISYKNTNIVFGGDTAYTEAYRELTDSADIAIMPIGAYDPWITNHCTPEQAVSMAEHMNTKWFIPIHFETFSLGKEHFKEPITRLISALEAHPTIQLAIDKIGGEFTHTKG